MPRIDLITPVEYNSLWPYNSNYDNLPLKYILARQDLINLAVDQSEEILRNSVGTAGSLSNRLNQSLEEDGSLKTTAVDESLHNIGAHEDGTYESIDYVRMKADERDKLELIADEATSLKIQFETVSTTVLFENETVEFQDSETVQWTVTVPNIITANLAFPATAAHEHNYDLVPVHDNLLTPDYINYKSTSGAIAYIEGSLRVYINGIRISENVDVYVYVADSGPSGTWYATSFTPDAENGTFALSRAIDASDVITIDFDRSFI